MRKETKIVHSNTDIKRLWMLAKNGVFTHKTIQRIMDNEQDGYIVFNSKRSYDKYEKFKNSASAMYPM